MDLYILNQKYVFRHLKGAAKPSSLPAGYLVCLGGLEKNQVFILPMERLCPCSSSRKRERFQRNTSDLGLENTPWATQTMRDFYI
jgi:hypothetical protein